MAAWSVGGGKAATGFGPGVLWTRNGTASWRAQGPAALDIDGTVAVPVVHVGGVNNLSVGASGASPSGHVKTTSGRLCKAQVTTAGGGSVALLIYDNSLGDNSGTVIGVIKAAAAVGDQYTFDMPAANGISIPAQAGAPTVTLSYS